MISERKRTVGLLRESVGNAELGSISMKLLFALALGLVVGGDALGVRHVAPNPSANRPRVRLMFKKRRPALVSPFARQFAHLPASLLVRVEARSVVGALRVVVAVDHALLHQDQRDLVLQPAS